MIKLTDLLEINKIKYSDKVEKKHQKTISMKTELIDSDETIPQTPFPENSSRQTRSELEFLVNYNNGKIDKKFVKEGDNILPLFEKYCKDNNLDFDKKYYKQILNESSKTILSMKYYYNRPRPHQLAEFYGILKFEKFDLPSMKTPSYPSGHSTQGYILSGLLGKKYSSHYDNFEKIAESITNSRLMARCHYPTDCEFGKKVANHIISKIIQKENK
tara:strand:+ start:171 stop:818 length:648 start_codon:yes stop_codon:yes gene_type:complete